MAYSEIKPGTVEKQELARQAFVKTLKDNPKLSKDACWAIAKQDNPKLFAGLQAADEEREKEKTHGSFQPSNPALHQSSKDRIQCVGFAQEDGSLIIQGAFANPLF